MALTTNARFHLMFRDYVMHAANTFPVSGEAPHGAHLGFLNCATLKQGEGEISECLAQSLYKWRLVQSINYIFLLCILFFFCRDSTGFGDRIQVLYCTSYESSLAGSL